MTPEILGADQEQELKVYEQQREIPDPANQEATTSTDSTKEDDKSKIEESKGNTANEEAPKKQEDDVSEDNDMFSSLADMGFDDNVIRAARKKWKGVTDINRILEWCFSNPVIEEETVTNEAITSTNEPVLPESEEQLPENFTGLFDDDQSLPGYYYISDEANEIQQSNSISQQPTSISNTKETQISEKPVNKSEEIEPKKESNLPRRKIRKVPLELQRLFAALQLCDQRAVPTEYLTKSFGWNGREVYQQHDVHELNR